MGDLAAAQHFVQRQAEVFNRFRQTAERQLGASQQLVAAAASAEELCQAEAVRLGEAHKVRPAACLCICKLQIAQGHIHTPARLGSEDPLRTKLSWNQNQAVLECRSATIKSVAAQTCVVPSVRSAQFCTNLR